MYLYVLLVRVSKSLKYSSVKHSFCKTDVLSVSGKAGASEEPVAGGHRADGPNHGHEPVSYRIRGI